MKIENGTHFAPVSDLAPPTGTVGKSGASQQNTTGSPQTKLSDAFERALENFDHIIGSTLGLGGTGGGGGAGKLQNKFDIEQTLRRSDDESPKEVSRDLQSLSKALDDKSKDLQNQDKLGNFEIQSLMSEFNEAQTLASSVLKKKDDAGNAVIKNI